MNNLQDPIETSNWGGLIGKIAGNSAINPLLRAAALFTPFIAYLATRLPTGAYTYILLTLLALLVLGILGCFVFIMLRIPARLPSEMDDASESGISGSKVEIDSSRPSNSSASIMPELAELWEVSN